MEIKKKKLFADGAVVDKGKEFRRSFKSPDGRYCRETHAGVARSGRRSGRCLDSFLSRRRPPVLAQRRHWVVVCLSCRAGREEFVFLVRFPAIAPSRLGDASAACSTGTGHLVADVPSSRAQPSSSLRFGPKCRPPGPQPVPAAAPSHNPQRSPRSPSLPAKPFFGVFCA